MINLLAEFHCNSCLINGMVQLISFILDNIYQVENLENHKSKTVVMDIQMKIVRLEG